jgi:hypothetical protein
MESYRGHQEKATVNFARELRLAKSLYRDIPRPRLRELRDLLRLYQLSLSSGEITDLNGAWYVTHSGLLRIAAQMKCAGIRTSPAGKFSDPIHSRWVFKAIVYKSARCKGFVGFGDADPSNVPPLLHGSVMRIAETRAVNRALRKAYGIGICSVEEIGSSTESRPTRKMPPQPTNGNGNYGCPKVRDRLCQLIRQHRLDAGLVKSYAVDFCGTNTLREATREQVEAFVAHLSDWAEKDRNALLCQLNSYLPPQSKQEGAA